MVALLSFVALLLPALLARTSPVPVEFAAGGQVYSHAQRAQYGVPVGSDVTRFVVKYANAQRWKPSTVASISLGVSLFQQVPIFSSYFVGPSLTSLVCRTSLPLALSLVQVRRPRIAFIWLFMFPTPSAPVAMLPLSFGSFSTGPSPVTRAQCLLLDRLPGGSFVTGSASDLSINGANLATATQSIVAVAQHRLGGVGIYPLLRLLYCSPMCSSASWLPTEIPTWPSTMSSTL